MLSRINFPLLGLIAFSAKFFLLPIDINSVLLLGIFAFLYGFSLFLNKKYAEVPEINKQTTEEIEKLKTTISTIKLAMSQRRQ